MKNTENHKSETNGENKDSKGILLNILITLALTAVCIVFEVLCIKSFKAEFVEKNQPWILALVCGLTIVYCLLAILFSVKGKTTVYRVLFSGYLLIIFFLVLL